MGGGRVRVRDGGRVGVRGGRESRCERMCRGWRGSWGEKRIEGYSWGARGDEELG
jgi:hypothetical protein